MSHSLIEISDHGARAVISPEMGGWLLRYEVAIIGQGRVEVLHYDQAVVDRYPLKMYAGSPVLFPMVSFNHLPGREHHYAWAGQEYPLPQHGFARRLPWQVIEKTSSSLLMELTDSDATRLVYPLQFCFRLKYWLEDGRLFWSQEVQNLGQQTMPFSSGYHPYFRIPLGAASQRSACEVELPASREVKADPKSGQLDFGTPQPPRSLPVMTDVAGTLFLMEMARHEVSLLDQSAKIRVTFNFEGAPRYDYLALWSPSVDEKFYCLEPWTALPNSFLRGDEAELILLQPQEKFAASFWLDANSVEG